MVTISEYKKRMNAKGAMAALITGFSLGIIRLAVDTPPKLIQGFSYTSGSFLWIFNNIFFQYYSILIAIVCAAVMLIVSYRTAEPDYARISGLTYGTVTDEHRSASRASWGRGDVIASVLVVILILAAYLYFVG